MVLACISKTRDWYFILTWKLEGKKLLVRLTCGWKENIKLGLQVTGWDGKDWINPIQVRK